MFHQDLSVLGRDLLRMHAHRQRVCNRYLDEAERMAAYVSALQAFKVEGDQRTIISALRSRLIKRSSAISPIHFPTIIGRALNELTVDENGHVKPRDERSLYGWIRDTRNSVIGGGGRSAPHS